MSLTVESISELDPTLVQNAQLQLSQMLQERYPEVELRRGVIHDIVLLLYGICAGINRTENQRVLESQSLLAVTQNPALADPAIVDAALSNLLITRKTGSHAKGNITIVVEGDATVVISAQSLYVANGLNFRTDVPITARPPGTITSDPNDRILSARGDGSFEFAIPATAENVGEDYNLRINTKFIPSPPPPRFVTAYSANDFVGGTATESNADLLSRKADGIPAKLIAGPANIRALIKAQPVFADVKNISVIGFTDPEMTRDQHWIFPVSGGGRVDLYCQMNALPQTLTIQKTARLVSKTETTSVWQLTINRNDAPGFYTVAGIRRLTDPADLAGFEIVSDARGWDFGVDTYVPDIQTITEAVYTKYQTCVLQFRDTLTVPTALTIGDTKDFKVSLTGQPLLRELQDFVLNDTHRNVAADVVVKGAVPCFLSINFTIFKSATETAPNTASIATAIAAFVNNLNFPGELYASQLTDIVHNSLTGTQAVGAVDMHGVIYRPDGGTTTIRDNQILRIPETPSALVTPRTTIFVLYPDDIGITVTNRSNG